VDLIALLKAALLGLVEGATEFIPVSSTGHLILAQECLGLAGRKEDAFIVFIQLGAILSVVWLYRQKFTHLLMHWRRDMRARGLLVNLVIATLPAVIIGLPTADWIEAHLFRPLPVVLALVAGGLAILLIERWHRPPTVDSVDGIPAPKALQVGVLQVLAVVFPGVSRSGATIMGGLAVGLSRRSATEFSFFLAVPAMLGAALVKMAGVRDLIVVSDLPTFGLGFVVSFLSALVVVRALLRFVSHHSFVPFAWYRIALGALLLAHWAMGRTP
jgi:undecaprenyl-diphosphatase